MDNRFQTICAALAVFAMAETAGVVGAQAKTADPTARALSQPENHPATAMDSLQSRTPSADLQRERANRGGTMPAAPATDPRYHFYGGQY
jgi:hypothetical protein